MSSVEVRKLSGLREEKESLHAKLHQLRKKISISGRNQELAELKRVANVVDKLQKVFFKFMF